MADMAVKAFSGAWGGSEETKDPVTQREQWEGKTQRRAEHTHDPLKPRL